MNNFLAGLPGPVSGGPGGAAGHGQPAAEGDLINRLIYLSNIPYIYLLVFSLRTTYRPKSGQIIIFCPKTCVMFSNVYKYSFPILGFNKIFIFFHFSPAPLPALCPPPLLPPPPHRSGQGGCQEPLATARTVWNEVLTERFLRSYGELHNSS